MEASDADTEKIRLVTLAIGCGFDEQSAHKCLDRLIHLYGIISHLFLSFHFETLTILFAYLSCFQSDV